MRSIFDEAADSLRTMKQPSAVECGVGVGLRYGDERRANSHLSLLDANSRAGIALFVPECDSSGEFSRLTDASATLQ